MFQKCVICVVAWCRVSVSFFFSPPYTWTRGLLTRRLLDDQASHDSGTSDDVTGQGVRYISVSSPHLYLNHLFLSFLCQIWLLKEVTMHIAVFWVVMSCSLLEKCPRFGRTYCLLLQSRKTNQSSNEHSLFYFEPEDWGSNFSKLLPDHRPLHARR